MPLQAPKPKHICKFKRHTYKSGGATFFCTLPDCSKKMTIALALGKECICWRCGQPFILNEYALRLAKPHCEACHQPKRLKSNTELAEVADVTVTLLTEAEASVPPELTLAERLAKTISDRQNQVDDEGDI